MAGAVSGLITFGTQNGPIATGNLDTNFTAFQTAVNSANSYSNYLVDSGSANTIAVTVASPAAATLSAGLTLTIKVAQTNTGATTLNLNGGGAVAVVDPLGAPLASNDLNAGGIFTFVYNGTYWQVLGALASGSTGVAFADTFTATAGQTVFTLSNNPGNINNLGVSLDGSVLVASIDYTWTSPKTLTLTAGAKAGQTLFVRYIENYTIGTPIAAGTNNQIQYNNSGVLNGTTIGGDATLVATTGALTVTKTAGVAFAASATTDTTNAANISSGILPVARQSYTQGGTGSVARTVTNKLQESVSVKDFGAVGDGVTDDTTAINAAITYAKSLSTGMTIYFPQGTYAVTEINLTNSTAVFTKTIRLLGSGRFVSQIIPYASGNVLLNMMGTNDAIVQDLSFVSNSLASQTAIFMARSTTSVNCNNNKFLNVWISGSYSVASQVCNGSESSYWIGGRFENTNASANYCCFRTGGATGVAALQGITTVNGGTILDSNNPNTDNRMYGVEFYAPFASAQLVKFDYSAAFQFYGCTAIAGSSNNVRLVTYRANAAASNSFLGPIAWFGCHFEVFGTGNVAHYLNGNGSAVSYFQGLSNYGGYYNTGTSSPAALIDYDRTNILEQPVLRGGKWTSPTTSPGSTLATAYVFALFSCNFEFKSNESEGTLILGNTGYLNNSTVDVVNFLGCGTRFVACYHTSVASALPTTGSFTVGETIQRETPVVGQPTGWKCTVSGTLGTLNGGATTGGITIGTNVLTVNSATGLAEGQKIAVAGSVNGPYYISKLSGTTAYLNLNAGATVAGAAVSFSNATLVALANL